MKKISTIILLLICSAIAACSSCKKSMQTKQQSMVERQIRFRGISDKEVLRVMREVPREEFVLPQYRDKAYDDLEVPIGEDQTLDRPYEDALMLTSLKLKPTDRVLEVGTGSGYLSALMSQLAKEVYTIEILPALGNRAREILHRLGYHNVEVKIGDGFVGWEEHAPFDVILLTCSPTEVPKPLKDQLAEGGRLILPLGGEEKFQELLLYTKKDGKFVLERRIAPTTFVPMKGMVEEQK